MTKLDINGRMMSYQDVGTGFPIVLAHSFLWDSSMWAPQIEALSRKYRCIVPELWSHGASDVLDEEPVSIKTLMADHVALLDHLGLDRVAFVGLSIGGMIGLNLAIEHPHRLQSLTVMDSYVGEEGAESKKSYLELMDLLCETGYFSDPLIKAIVPYFFSPSTYQTQPDLIHRFEKDLSKISFHQVEGIVRIGRAIFTRSSLLSKLPHLRVPTQYLVGEDDIARPYRESAEMAALTPKAECFSIPQAGHIASLEQAALVNEKIESFIDACFEKERRRSAA